VKATPLLLVVAACGGAPKPATHDEQPVVVSAKPTTRVPIEDTPADGDDTDGVRLEGQHGHMEPAVVDTGISPHKTDLADCYASRVGRRRWLGGHVTLHWDIKADGTVTAVKLSESDLGAWSVEKCLLDIAKSATFGRPVNGDADFAVPLDFSARGATAVWDEDQGLRAVGKQLARLDTCARGKIHMPADVTITVYVGPHGQAQSVGFSSAKTVLDETWAACAEKAAMAWHLPDPRGEIAKLAIRYRPE
jgi:hypothetical protein